MKVLKLFLTVVATFLLVAISILAWFPLGAAVFVWFFVSFFFRYALRLNSPSATSEQATIPFRRRLAQHVLSRDLRIACIIWLFCAAVIAGLGWWYPNWVADRYSSSDDRYGFVLLAMMPFYLVGLIVTIRAGFRLFVLIAKQTTASNVFLAFLGALLALIAISPAVVIFLRLLSTRMK